MPSDDCSGAGASMSEKLLDFNSAPQIERICLANGQFCFVVHDAVVDPDRLVRFAKAQRQQFRSTLANGYPGVLLPASDEVSAAVNDFFSFHMRRCFDSRRTLHMHGRPSIVTTPPRDLQPYQSICHRDSPSSTRRIPSSVAAVPVRRLRARRYPLLRAGPITRRDPAAARRRRRLAGRCVLAALWDGAGLYIGVHQMVHPPRHGRA